MAQKISSWFFPEVRLFCREAVKQEREKKKNTQQTPLQLSRPLAASVPPNGTWLPCVDAFTVLVINAVSFVIKKNNFLPLYSG